MKLHHFNPCYWSYCLWKRRYNKWTAKRDLQIEEDLKIVGEHNRLHPEDLRIYVPYIPLKVIFTGSNSRWLAKAAEVKINCGLLKETVKLYGDKRVRVVPPPALLRKIVFGEAPEWKNDKA